MRLVAVEALPEALWEGFVGGRASADYVRRASGARAPAWGFAALAGDVLLGSVSLKTHAALAGRERLAFLRLQVQPAWRRRGLGGRLLLGATEVALRRSSRLRLVTYPEAEELAAARPFLTRFGFRETAGIRFYRARLAAVSEPEPVPGLEVRLWRGEDDLEDAALALYHRAFRGQEAVPELTPAIFGRQLSLPGWHCLLLLDRGRPVGIATFSLAEGLCSVDFLLVARSHWGTGGADLLVHAIQRLAVERGCREIASAAAAANRASCALIERTAPGSGRSWVAPRFTRLCLSGNGRGVREADGQANSPMPWL